MTWLQIDRQEGGQENNSMATNGGSSYYCYCYSDMSKKEDKHQLGFPNVDNIRRFYWVGRLSDPLKHIVLVKASEYC